MGPLKEIAFRASESLSAPLDSQQPHIRERYGVLPVGARGAGWTSSPPRTCCSTFTQPLYLNFTHEAIVNRFERHYEAHDKITGDVYVCDTPPEENNDELPPDVELVRLQPEHMAAVYDLYPASDIECREVFEKLVAELPAYGVFVEGELAAWMVQSYYGAMFSMQTRPEYRRKGFGTCLARRLTRAVAARGYRPVRGDPA
ncbi:hypothetical protein ACJJTC_000162 [Scirpophaga incertulas]